MKREVAPLRECKQSEVIFCYIETFLGVHGMCRSWSWWCTKTSMCLRLKVSKLYYKRKSHSVFKASAYLISIIYFLKFKAKRWLFDNKLYYKFVYLSKHQDLHKNLVSSRHKWRFISQYLESITYEKLNYQEKCKWNTYYKTVISQCMSKIQCLPDFFIPPPTCISVLSLILKEKSQTFQF